MSDVEAGGALCKLHHLFVGEDRIALLGAVEYSFYAFFCCFQTVAFEPENYVRFSAHWSDVDALFAVEHSSRHSRIDHIGKPVIAFVKGLDKRGGVDSCRGAK